MQLASQYYVEFLRNNVLSEVNKENLRECLEDKDNMTFSKVKMLEAMLATKQYPNVMIRTSKTDEHSMLSITLQEEDVVCLLNKLVCKTEFMLAITSEQDKKQLLKISQALNYLMYEFKIYIEDGITRNKQYLPMKQ